MKNQFYLTMFKRKSDRAGGSSSDRAVSICCGLKTLAANLVSQFTLLPVSFAYRRLEKYGKVASRFDFLRIATTTNGLPGLLIILMLPVALTLTGCITVGPDYRPPELPAPTAWHRELEGGLTTEQTAPETLAGWWKTLKDPELSSLIERAIAGNLDLKQAVVRVREARIRSGLSGTSRYPSISSVDSATWSSTNYGSGPTQTNQRYSAGLDASWELDLFGGVRRSMEAAGADLDADIESLHDVMISLLSEVALNYIEVRTYQSRLSATEANLKIQEDSYQLTVWKHKAGLDDALSVQQALYNLESTRSQIPTLRTGMEAAKNRIAGLLGVPPGAIHPELEKPALMPVPPLEVAVGMPADALRQRPDVRKAERELAAQTARIGVAAADLYPKFTLGGSIGLDASSISDFSSTHQTILSGGPKFSWAIFNAGSIRKNIQIQSAMQEEALLAYESTILTALEEVENALTAYAEEQIKRIDLQKATQAAQQAAELTQQMYQSGLRDFINVLEADRSLLSLQDQLAQSEGTVTANLVRLYKTLGGGWTSPTSDLGTIEGTGQTSANGVIE